MLKKIKNCNRIVPPGSGRFFQISHHPPPAVIFCNIIMTCMIYIYIHILLYLSFSFIFFVMNGILEDPISRSSLDLSNNVVIIIAATSSGLLLGCFLDIVYVVYDVCIMS